MTDRAQNWLDQYGESHQNPTNKGIHVICVPVIYWSIFALLWLVPVPGNLPWWINWATLVMLAVQAYYFWLSPALGFGMLIVNALVLAITLMIAGSGATVLASAAIAAFIVAWIVQFVGHQIEGKRPAFFKDVQFLLIGPFWLLAALYRKLDLRY